MKNKIIMYPVFVALCILFVHCTQSDDYKKYMPDDGIIYPQKADAVKTYPGKNRIRLEWVLVDPKVTSCEVIYEQAGIQESITVPIQARGDFSNDTIRIDILDLEETTYSFKIVSYDKFGNTSIPVEVDESVYGDMYESSLVNRVVKNVDYDEVNNGLKLDWYAAENTVIGVYLTYTDINGDKQMKEVDIEDTSTTIADFKLGEPLLCTTKFKPVPSAIDTFSAKQQRIGIKMITNVALNKPVTHSDFLAGYPGQNAVNGDRTNSATRWVSDDTANEHWIEIDLQGSYSINSFQLFLGPTATEPMRQFRLQAWVADEWTTVVSEDNNTFTLSYLIYYRDFEPVTTNKVRWYFPPYTGNRVRLYEIEVYSVITY